LQGLRVDPGFTHDRMQSDGIGVVGVTTLVHEDMDRAAFRSQMSSLLRLKLLDENPFLTIVPAGAFRNGLGGDAYESAMDDYRLSGTFAPVDRDSWMRAPGTPVRYVILARIEDDFTSQKSTDEVKEENERPHAYNHRITERSVAVAFQVVDLRTGNEVWGATIWDTGRNSNRYDMGEVRQEGEEDPLESVSQAVVEALRDRPYPSPPALTEMLGSIFRDFARSLPRAAKR
jgi:hypothetical protein